MADVLELAPAPDPTFGQGGGGAFVPGGGGTGGFDPFGGLSPLGPADPSAPSPDNPFGIPGLPGFPGFPLPGGGGGGGNSTGPGPAKLPSTGNATLDKILAVGGPLASLIIGLLGLGGNISGGRQQGALRSAETQAIENLLNMVQNPALFAKLVQSIQQPLNTGLVESVMNPTQAALGERGLGQSPAPAAAVTSQALAPFEQNNQQTATNAALGLLGLPGGFTGAAGLPFSPTPGVFDDIIKGIIGTISGIKGTKPAGPTAPQPTVGDANLSPDILAALDPGITLPGTNFGQVGG